MIALSLHTSHGDLVLRILDVRVRGRRRARAQWKLNRRVISYYRAVEVLHDWLYGGGPE